MTVAVAADSLQLSAWRDPDEEVAHDEEVRFNRDPTKPAADPGRPTTGPTSQLIPSHFRVL
jgi:hypothetical protein